MTEQEQIKEAFEDLLKSLRKETSKENRQKIKEAFEFANEAHKGVKRRSGEPYILHPLAVAKIAVKEIGLGTTSVISALLHDVVEDTDYTVEDIANLFGPKVASIVDGLTKISGVMGSDTSRQAEFPKDDPDAGRRCPGDPDQDCRPFAQYAYAGFYARA
ncbi:MAG: HD domain-containing protein [Odoribacter splanchnicus]